MKSSQRILVKTRIKSLNNNKKFTQVIQATGGFEVLDSADSRPVDLLIYELGDSPKKDFEFVQSIIDSGEVAEVFLTGDSVEPGLLMQAMRLGVKEYLPQPLNEDEIRLALDRFMEQQHLKAVVSPAPVGKVVSVFGSKGGVGTTTVAVNLAVSLAKTREPSRVVLLDMNTLFGEIPLFLEMAPKFDWGEITKNIDRLDDTFLSNILTQHRTGVKVLPSPAYLNGHVRPTPEIMTKLLGLMKRMFDFVIIDAGQSTNETALKVLQISDTLLLISILSLPCLANTNKLLRSLTELGYVPQDRIKVVLNRYIKKGEISLKDAEAGIGKDLFFTIPNEYGATMAAINNGKPLIEVAPRAEITQSFLGLATSLRNPRPEEEKKKKKSTLFGLA